MRKTAIVALCAIFLAGLGAAIGLDLYYFSNLPKQPEPASGRVHRLTVSHGSVRYGSQVEVHRIHQVETCAIVATACGVIAGILNFVYRDFSLPGRSRPD